MAYDRTPLSKEALQKFLAEHPGWELTPNNGLLRTYTFQKFLDGVEFVRAVAQVAEKHDHHPDIDIRYTKVKLFLTTHDAGGLTFRDPAVASEADALYRG